MSPPGLAQAYQITARHIRFDEEALRTAQALESRVDPVEDLAKSTQTLAENNQQRIGVVEENAQRISGQVEELSSVANSSVAAAKVAQSTADQAESDATTANTRINELGDYDVLATIAVHFKNGSARLSPEAMSEIDVVTLNHPHRAALFYYATCCYQRTDSTEHYFPHNM